MSVTSVSICCTRALPGWSTHDRLATEDLNVTAMVANHRLAGAIGDASWAQFARMLGYAQPSRGGRISVVDRRFPSCET
jgi:putative transposase